VTLRRATVASVGFTVVLPVVFSRGAGDELGYVGRVVTPK
jgi:hypothetical protein